MRHHWFAFLFAAPTPEEIDRRRLADLRKRIWSELPSGRARIAYR